MRRLNRAFCVEETHRDSSMASTVRLLAGAYLLLDRTGLSAAQAAGAIVEMQCRDRAVQE